MSRPPWIFGPVNRGDVVSLSPKAEAAAEEVRSMLRQRKLSEHHFEVGAGRRKAREEQRPEGAEPRIVAEQLTPFRRAGGVVFVEKPRRGRRPERAGDPAGEIVGLAQPHIHALTPERTGEVRRVPRHPNPANAESRRELSFEERDRRPLDRAHLNAEPGGELRDELAEAG